MHTQVYATIIAAYSTSYINKVQKIYTWIYLNKLLISQKTKKIRLYLHLEKYSESM